MLVLTAILALLLCSSSSYAENYEEIVNGSNEKRRAVDAIEEVYADQVAVSKDRRFLFAGIGIRQTEPDGYDLSLLRSIAVGVGFRIVEAQYAVDLRVSGAYSWGTLTKAHFVADTSGSDNSIGMMLSATLRFVALSEPLLFVGVGPGVGVYFLSAEYHVPPFGEGSPWSHHSEILLAIHGVSEIGIDLLARRSLELALRIDLGGDVGGAFGYGLQVVPSWSF